MAIAALSDGDQGGVERCFQVYRESTQSWSDVLRGPQRPWNELSEDWWLETDTWVYGERFANVYPDASEQRCWNHKIINVLDKLPKRQHDQAKLMLRKHPVRPIAGLRQSV